MQVFCAVGTSSSVGMVLVSWGRKEVAVYRLPPLSSSCVSLHLHWSMAAGSFAFLQPWVSMLPLFHCLLWSAIFWPSFGPAGVLSSSWCLLFRQMEWFPELQYFAVALPLAPFFSNCHWFIVYARTPMCFPFMLGAFTPLCSTLWSLFWSDSPVILVSSVILSLILPASVGLLLPLVFCPGQSASDPYISTFTVFLLCLHVVRHLSFPTICGYRSTLSFFWILFTPSDWSIIFTLFLLLRGTSWRCSWFLRSPPFETLSSRFPCGSWRSWHCFRFSVHLMWT